jgi:protein gp37
MAENTKIQWCDHTFNPWIGCTKVQEGCLNCYAEELMANRYQRVEWGPKGTRSRTKTWNQPKKWNKQSGKLALDTLYDTPGLWDDQAASLGEKRKVFCASLADVFEAKDEVTPWRADLFNLIDECQNLHWLLLTKRPQHILQMWPQPLKRRENVWLGTSIAVQKNVDVYIPLLLKSRELCRYLFLSVEPQVGFIDLNKYLFPKPLVDWVIIGGESKQGKSEPRPYDILWARTLLAQCRAAGVPCFIKQFGSIVYDDGRRMHFEDGHGGNMEEWPEDLRVRECPETYHRVAA